MIAVASGDDTSIEPALRRLKLIPAQQDAAIEDYRQHLAQDDEEDATIARHQDLTNEALLNGPKSYATQDGFQSLASVHLYNNLCPELGIRRVDVVAARAYMEFCNLKTDFLDDWVQPDQPPPEISMEEEAHHDAQWPNSVSLEEILRKKETDISPSTPTSQQLPTESIPRVIVTPVPQRYRTPPIPQTPQTIEINVRPQGPLQGLRANLLAASRQLDWDNTDVSRRTHLSPSKSRLLRSPPSLHDQESITPVNVSSGSEMEPQPKRKRPHTVTKKGTSPTSNGHHHTSGTNGTNKPFRYNMGSIGHAYPNGSAMGEGGPAATSSHGTVDVPGQKNTPAVQNGALVGEDDGKRSAPPAKKKKGGKPKRSQT